MKKKSFIPQTRVKNPEPKEKDDNWIIWAAWVMQERKKVWRYAVLFRSGPETHLSTIGRE